MEINNQPIGQLELKTAQETLQKYISGKANLDQTVIDNEEWYKRKQNRCYKSDKLERLEKGSSAWLFNSLANKHADAMDSYPEPVILAKEQSDESTAKMLASIVPVILDRCDFENTYNDTWWDKLKNGAGIYSIMWDKDKDDIAIKEVDMLSIYWEPGIQDIQDSRNVFILDLVDNDILLDKYPNLEGKLSTNAIDKKRYHYDDNVDTTNKSIVVDWYYKQSTMGGTIVHYVRYVNDTILFATENEPGYENGLYNHGLYPLVFDVLFPLKGTPVGIGYLDICKQPQDYIDRLGTAILLNAEEAARRRYLVKDNASINEEEFSDINNRIIHCSGSPNDDNFRPLDTPALPGTYLSVLQDKVNELKETTANRDFNQGGTSSGITAASAIQALQESGNKISRSIIRRSYTAYAEMVRMIVELIRQFYDYDRTFRIVGSNGDYEYVTFNNAALQSQMQNIGGIEFKTKEPDFDIKIKAQKSNPYSKMSQNELALQFYSAGFFNPQMADQALLCVDMMDFDGKDKVRESIANQKNMFDQLQQMTQIATQAAEALAAKGDPRVIQALQQSGIIMPQAPLPNSSANLDMEAVNDKNTIL